MFSPTSMSAMSIETIWKAVWASRPRWRTALEIVSGCSMTSKWLSAEPIDVMIPSPTRAMIVSSVAPPMSCEMLVRTVTRARIFSSTPFLATADSVDLPLILSGQSMTFGLTLVWTASRTSRPARSMAQARSKSRSMSARCAAISARVTRGTSPPAR